MTEVLAPPVGEVLTAETVKLLRAGDRLTSCWNWPHTRWLGACTVTSIPAEGRTLFMARFDQSGETGGFGGYIGDQLSGFTFLSRPSLAAPTVQVGEDLGSISAQEAEMPTAQTASSPLVCRNCNGAEWVCENHRDRPWGGAEDGADACECGAGAPCGVCNAEMAAATYTEPLRERLRAIQKAELAYRKVMDGRTTGHVLSAYADLQRLILKASQ